MRTVSLDDEVDLAGFRRACRRLLAEGIAPERVQWQVATAAAHDLFDASGESDALPATAEAGRVPHVPPGFVPLCAKVVLHEDPDRFGLLYRLLWRLQREPGLRSDPLDADRIRADRMAHAVRREMHKMTAFVRFRRIEAGSAHVVDGTGMAIDADLQRARTGHDAEADVLHVAWFEPAHHIVEATAPFFARRFARMRWAILTPERCVRWDGRVLSFGPGARRDEAPDADAGERLWLTYYQSIFNPARLKIAMMTKEMPRRYWHNLPEATLISSLAGQANQRSATMVDAPATTPRRRVVPLQVVGRETPRENAMADHAPATLAELKLATERCRECPIGANATQSVAGEGPLHAQLMVVGEQPGDQEDLRGRPFVGPAGQLLDRALAQLGWSRDALFVTNAVRHFKYELRGQRRIHKTPAQQEIAACLHWLEREIALVQPRAVVALGATAARALMGTAVPVMRERGRWLARGDGLRVLVTLHPSALLRLESAAKHKAFEAWLADLRQASEFMQAA